MSYYKTRQSAYQDIPFETGEDGVLKKGQLKASPRTLKRRAEKRGNERMFWPSRKGTLNYSKIKK